MPKAVATAVAIKAGGFKIGLELLMRARPATLIEVPYQFRDRLAGQSKMNTREAFGYLVQLKDLYPIRWSTFGRRPIRHEAWSPADVQRAISAQLKKPQLAEAEPDAVLPAARFPSGSARRWNRRTAGPPGRGLAAKGGACCLGIRRTGCTGGISSSGVPPPVAERCGNRRGR